MCQIFGIGFQLDMHLEFTVNVEVFTFPVQPGFGRQGKNTKYQWENEAYEGGEGYIMPWILGKYAVNMEFDPRVIKV